MSQKLKALIGPSILNTDLTKLYEESQNLLSNGADYLHLDVMDGHFVPNITMGHQCVRCLRKNFKDAYLETHMMVTNPEKWIVQMADAGVDLYTFHIEPVTDVREVSRKIKECGMKVGLAIKPSTPVVDVTEYIEIADMVLIMTIEPGFGGQKFMEGMMEKVQWLRENYSLIDIEVDGGIGPNNIKTCAEAGANMIVSGRAIINAEDQATTIKYLRDTVQHSIDYRMHKLIKENQSGDKHFK